MFVVPQHELVVGQVAYDSFVPDVELAFVGFVSTPNFVAVVAALYAAVVALREAFLVELEPCSVMLIDALNMEDFLREEKIFELGDQLFEQNLSIASDLYLL